MVSEYKNLQKRKSFPAASAGVPAPPPPPPPQAAFFRNSPDNVCARDMVRAACPWTWTMFTDVVVLVWLSLTSILVGHQASPTFSPHEWFCLWTCSWTHPTDSGTARSWDSSRGMEMKPSHSPPYPYNVNDGPWHTGGFLARLNLAK